MIYVKNWKFFHRLLLDKVDLSPTKTVVSLYLLDVMFPMRTPCVPSNIDHIIEVAGETWVCFIPNCTMGLVLFCSTNLDSVSSAFSR